MFLSVGSRTTEGELASLGYVLTSESRRLATYKSERGKIAVLNKGTGRLVKLEGGAVGYALGGGVNFRRRL